MYDNIYLEGRLTTEMDLALGHEIIIQQYVCVQIWNINKYMEAKKNSFLWIVIVQLLLTRNDPQ